MLEEDDTWLELLDPGASKDPLEFAGEVVIGSC